MTNVVLRDEIIKRLKLENVKLDFRDILDCHAYRRFPECKYFSFENVNQHSYCCEEDRIPTNKEMGTQFWKIVRLFGEYNSDDWADVFDQHGYISAEVSDENTYKCVCGHYIKNLHYIRHIPSNILLMVGNECVKKINENLANQKRVCKGCKGGFGKVDKRKQPFRDGFCSFTCKETDRLKQQLATRIVGVDANEWRRRKQANKEAREKYLLSLAKRISDKSKHKNTVVNNKLLLKDKIPEKKIMNIHSNDNQYLSQSDAKKLENYERVDFGNLNVGDHFRYTTNKYQQQGRKLAYGVVKTKELGSITVNGYSPNPEEEPMYPDWTIKHPDRNKQYNFYKKIKSYSQNVSDNISDDEIE